MQIVQVASDRFIVVRIRVVVLVLVSGVAYFSGWSSTPVGEAVGLRPSPSLPRVALVRRARGPARPPPRAATYNVFELYARTTPAARNCYVFTAIYNTYDMFLFD